ncbi:drebrin-like protein B isoform X2 [Ylistrum balloti]|uniref:drebrin-like protein B isoform X2 n=1 Tax=Ylistrum balloti TaxID=509963 RepID=UPI0029058BD2|nr:drebrin-like protein B isoform X2 [Ylistrum balloti]
MALDMRKNQDALIKAYRAVVDDKSETDWLIFGYEGQSSTLKLVAKGDGGIEEMADDLNGSKIMYAYCKVMDPNTNLPKYVLINWQGEAAPEAMKFKCANHVRDVSGFLKPVHVTIQARSDDDVDEDIIVGKVSKASGANYSAHSEKPKKPAKDGPVGSVYKRVNIANEINTKTRDEFWAEAEKEEQKRIAEERKKNQSERHREVVERKEREKQETEKREAQVRERMKAITEQRKLERRLSQQDSESEKQRWEKEQAAAFQEETERGKRSDILRRERAAEASKLTSNSAANARALFRRKESESMDEPPSPIRRGPPPPPKKLRQPAFLHQEQQHHEPKKPIILPTENTSDSVLSQDQNQSNHHVREPSPPPREPSPPPREPSPPPREPSPPPREPSPPPREPSPETQQPVMRNPSPQQPVMRDPSPPPQDTQLPRGRNLLAEGLPKRQYSDDEEEKDDDWDDNDSPPEVPSVHAVQPQFEEGEIDAYQQQMQEEAEDQGVCARALYDYQAADETEITFDPDDIITKVEQIDPGWWMGTDPSGNHGMFPSNYVELI